MIRALAEVDVLQVGQRVVLSVLSDLEKTLPSVPHCLCNMPHLIRPDRIVVARSKKNKQNTRFKICS